MDFSFTSEQDLLAESASQAMEKAGGLKLEEGGKNRDEVYARQKDALVELGAFLMMTPQESGGYGLGFVDCVAMMKRIGRYDFAFPVMETILACRCLGLASIDGVDVVAEGARSATVAHSGTLRDSAGKISGEVVAPAGKESDWLIAPLDDGLRAAVIDAAALTWEPVKALDLTMAYHRVVIADLTPSAIVPFNLREAMAILACAEIAGRVSAVLEQTADYLDQRVQFGKPLRLHQALKHEMADAWTENYGMFAAVEYAAWLADEAERGVSPESHQSAAMAIAVAKGFCSDSARTVLERCVQLHGGIGFTWEFGLHLSLRRMTHLSNCFGASHDRFTTIANDLLVKPDLA